MVDLSIVFLYVYQRVYSSVFSNSPASLSGMILPSKVSSPDAYLGCWEQNLRDFTDFIDEDIASGYGFYGSKGLAQSTD